MKAVVALFTLFRPLNLLLGASAVLISSAILESMGNFHTVIKAILVVVFLNAAANAFNDHRDLETDRINRRNRPLPLGKISPRTALASSLVLFGMGIVVSAFINPAAFFIATLIATPLMIAYSLWLKGWPLVGNIVVSVIIGLTFVFAGAAFGNVGGMFTAALLAFGLTMVREIIKDIADKEGDKAANLNTFPARFGIQTSIRLAIFLIFFLAVGVVIPYWYGAYGKLYLIVLALGIEIPLLFIVFFLMIFPSIRTCKISSQILKGCIVAGLLAIYLG
ncbi:MAG: geranylgeranylglycerol-phosphate geranylgeranyltransferase [Candidatus Neomarinimicrobiota bacterium]